MSEMTATRIGRPATIAVVVAAAVWVAAALLLLRTKVPGDLSLPQLDAEQVFGAGVTRAGERFERFFDYTFLLETLAGIAVLAVYLTRGRRLARRLPLGPVNAGIITAVFITVAVWAVSVPFDIAASWWSRRHDISQRSWSSIVFQPLGGLVGTAISTTIVISVVLLLAKRLPRAWWLAAAGVVLALALLLQFVLPYVDRLGAHGVRSKQLAAQIRTLERREHVGRPVVRVTDVSGETSAANAYSIGIGPSRTVIIWSTMLDGRFSSDEVRFVVAHELGHLARWHIWKGIAWGVLFGLPIFALVAYVTGRRGGLRRPENVPLALFTLAVAGLVVTPFANAVSRRYEAEADWMALQATRDPAAGRALFEHFVLTDLQNPDPPGWVKLLFEDHPSALARVEQIEAWRRLHR
jgi:STE24 endopeptidase